MEGESYSGNFREYGWAELRLTCFFLPFGGELEFIALTNYYSRRARWLLYHWPEENILS
jgi:hypothetical protein